MYEEKVNQPLKLLFLREILLRETDEEHGLSVAELMEKLRLRGVHADRKTMYKDLGLLRRSGLDILRTQEGRTVCYSVGNRFFELPELKLLVDAVQASRFITRKKSDVLINKLESLTSRYEARDLHRQVYVTDRVKTDNELIYYTVDQIHSAINDNRSVDFQYWRWMVNGEKDLCRGGAVYHVSPWALLWDNQNYYLIGFDDEKEEVRHFRVDKIVNLQITGQERSGRESFENSDVVSYTERMFGMFDGEESDVTLQVEPDLIGIFFDRFGQGISVREAENSRDRLKLTDAGPGNRGQEPANENSPESPAGPVEVTVHVTVSDQFLGWILSLGNGVKITGPDAVAGRMKDLLRERSSLY